MEDFNKSEHMYEPVEDSELLLKHAKSEVLALNSKSIDIVEVGVGSGFVLSNLAKDFSKSNFFGTDINPFAVEFTKRVFSKNKKKVIIRKGELLKPFSNKLFDLILFNTPYLPLENGDQFENLSLKNRAIYGGEKGWETIERFIIETRKHLKNNGNVIMVFSSLSNLDYIQKLLIKNLFEFEILESENSFFEKIYCLKFKKIRILEKIEKLKIKNLTYFTKGKHSLVFTGEIDKKEVIGNSKCQNLEEVIIKYGKSKDIQIEGIFLKKLEKERFSPRTFKISEEFIVMERIYGRTIREFLKEEKSKDNIKKALESCIKICQRLDEFKINKLEMTNPYKHIFIDENLRVMIIDFERSLYCEKPKNTTQFLQYLRKNISILANVGILICSDKIKKVSLNIRNENLKISLNNLLK